MEFTQENLAELKNNLFLEEKRIQGELQLISKPSLDGELTPIFNEIGSGEDENALEIEEYSDNLAIENTLEKQLKEVNQALDRINQGVYGKCENCGKNISLDRLRAYPSAKKCTAC